MYQRIIQGMLVAGAVFYHVQSQDVNSLPNLVLELNGNPKVSLVRPELFGLDSNSFTTGRSIPEEKKLIFFEREAILSRNENNLRRPYEQFKGKNPLAPILQYRTLQLSSASRILPKGNLI